MEKISWDDDEILDIDSNSIIFFLFLLVDFKENPALFKKLELAKMYLTNSFSSFLPPYSFHSKISRWVAKHSGTELGWFHESGNSSAFRMNVCKKTIMDNIMKFFSMITPSKLHEGKYKPCRWKELLDWENFEVKTLVVLTSLPRPQFLSYIPEADRS